MRTMSDESFAHTDISPSNGGKLVISESTIDTLALLTGAQYHRVAGKRTNEHVKLPAF